MTPALDLFITLLELGKPGWQRLLRQRKQLLPKFKVRTHADSCTLGGIFSTPVQQDMVQRTAAAMGQRLLDSPTNDVSGAACMAGTVGNGASGMNRMG